LEDTLGKVFDQTLFETEEGTRFTVQAGQDVYQSKHLQVSQLEKFGLQAKTLVEVAGNEIQVTGSIQHVREIIEGGGLGPDVKIVGDMGHVIDASGRVDIEIFNQLTASLGLGMRYAGDLEDAVKFVAALGPEGDQTVITTPMNIGKEIPGFQPKAALRFEYDQKVGGFNIKFEAGLVPTAAVTQEAEGEKLKARLATGHEFGAQIEAGDKGVMAFIRKADGSVAVVGKFTPFGEKGFTLTGGFTEFAGEELGQSGFRPDAWKMGAEIPVNVLGENFNMKAVIEAIKTQSNDVQVKGGVRIEF